MNENKIDSAIESVLRIKSSLDQAIGLLSQHGKVTVNEKIYNSDFSDLLNLLYSLKNSGD